jgi:hypothetical protein
MLTRHLRAWAVCGALLSTNPVAAAEYMVQSAPFLVRGDASQAESRALREGLEAKVVRKYLTGEGWRFVVTVPGLRDEAAGGAAAVQLATLLSGSVELWSVDGKELTKVRDVAPTAAVEPEPAAEIDPEVQRILVRAAAALGGPQGGKDVLDAASSVRFEYDRALEGGLEAHHVFVRRGADQALSVRIEGGDGIDSETRVLGGQAWLRTGRDGNFAVQDAQRGAELMSRASPVGVLPLVLTLADAIEGRPELRMMSHRGSATVEGEACDVLVFAGDRTSGPMSFEIGQSKGLVRRVSFEDGVVHQFDDYFAPATGLQIPRTIRTWRDGKLLETTRITALDLNGSLPESMLQTP